MSFTGPLVRAVDDRFFGLPVIYPSLTAGHVSHIPPVVGAEPNANQSIPHRAAVAVVN